MKAPYFWLFFWSFILFLTAVFAVHRFSTSPMEAYQKQFAAELARLEELKSEEQNHPRTTSP